MELSLPRRGRPGDAVTTHARTDARTHARLVLASQARGARNMPQVVRMPRHKGLKLWTILASCLILRLRVIYLFVIVFKRLKILMGHETFSTRTRNLYDNGLTIHITHHKHTQS